MKKPLSLFSALSFAALLSMPAFCEEKAAKTAAPQDTELEALSTRLDRMFAEAYPQDEPGAVVLVAKDGQTVLRHAYGMADLEFGVPLEPDMVFRLGSITKQFTAVAVMMLAEEGKLSVDDEVTEHLPDYPAAGAKITIEHLLTHTSGIPNYTDSPELMADVRDDRTVDEMLDLFKDRELEFEPGSKWSYSNSGYILLGAVIEKVSGAEYADFVRQRIFEPLGMEQSYYGSNPRVIPRRARGYHPGDDGGYVNAPYLSMSIPYAAGSLLSTVDDMARWNAALDGEELLPRAALKRMWTSYELADGEPCGYGYGWSVGEHQGSAVIQHGGGIHGFATMGIRMPREGLYVAVLSNNPAGGTSAGQMGRRAAALALGEEIELAAVEIAPQILERYVGVYQVDEETESVVTLEDGRLYGQLTGGRKNPLSFSSETEFFIEDTLIRGRFELAVDGQVTGATITAWAQPETTAVRTDKPIPQGPEVADVDPAVYDAYAGKYELFPNFVLTVWRDGDRLITQATGQQEIEIFPESETDFFAKLIPAKLSFVRDAASGEVTSLVLKQGGREVTGKRIE